MLYFAYGSNLHHFQMKRRCKDSVYLKKINLKGFNPEENPFKNIIEDRFIY